MIVSSAVAEEESPTPGEAAVAVERAGLPLHRCPSESSLGDGLSTVFGDSVASEGDEQPEQPIAPKCTSCVRKWARRRDTKPATPIVESGQTPAAPAAADAEEKPEVVSRIGNAGWYYGNWGSLTQKDGQAHNAQMAKQIRHVLKRNPAQIIGLCECEAALDALLQEPPDESPQQAKPQSGRLERPAFEYLTMRGQEASSVLLGVRANTGRRVELLHWDRLAHGKYRKKTAYSRVLHSRIITDQNIGCVGKSHTVMVIHVHRHLANNVWPTKLKQFWDWLAERLLTCDVLMGDFNMAFFMVVPEIRSRGVTIDLGAWFPWKAPDGRACADSCGIFFVNRPGIFHLKTGLADLHADDKTGFFWEQPAVAGGSDEPFDIFELNGGPGFPLQHYLPKENVQDKVRETLTPSLDEKGLAKLRGEGLLLKVSEKRLERVHFECMGKHQKGSHYPLCVYTQNPGWRSPEKFKERSQAWAKKCAQSSAMRGRSRGQQASHCSDEQGSWKQESHGWGSHWHGRWSSGSDTWWGSDDTEARRHDAGNRSRGQGSHSWKRAQQDGGQR